MANVTKNEVVGDWEDLFEDETPKPATKVTNEANELKNGNKKKETKKIPEDEILDPLEQKLRNQRLVEEEDQKLMADLFSGCERPELPETTKKPAEKKTSQGAKTTSTTIAGDSISKTELKSLKDCELFAEKISDKIQNSPAKSPAWLRLLDLFLKDCATKMTVQDLTTLKNKIQVYIKQKEDAKRDSAINKKKPNDIGKTMKDFKDEMDLFYGELSNDEEDDDYYKDFM